MSNHVEIHILRAFVDEVGRYGNPTGIIVDNGQKLSSSQRQKIATDLHFTDTVFINDLNTLNVSFHNPQEETKFAGDSLISTAYLVRYVLGREFQLIVCKGGEIKTWEENELTWIEASLEGTPLWNHQQLESAKAVDNITDEEAAKYEHTMVWAWIDEKKGLVRSRTFLPDWGTLEDQGNGSGSMQLVKMIGRKLEIHQGLGSVIFAEPSKGNIAKVGGRVRVDKSKLIMI